MACDLQTGFLLGCRDNSGGTSRIFIKKYNSADTYTAGLDGKITAMTSTDDFFQYDLQKNTAELIETQTMTAENETIGYEPVINIVFNKLDTPKRNEMLLLARTPVVAVVADRNNRYWLVGKSGGLDMLTSTRGTGINITDRNGSTIALTGSEPEPFVEIDFAAFSALISTVQI